MGDQREMTLDEYLESKLPDSHLARRQLQELREEREALAAHVERLHMAWVDAKRCVSVVAFPALYRVEQYQHLAKRSIEKLESVVSDTPTTSLTRLKAEWQTEALERLRELLQTSHMDQAPTVSRAAMHVNDAINRVAQECGVVTIRSQAEGGEA